MRSWKGDKPDVFALASWSIYNLLEVDALKLEKAIAMLYTQTSFNHFGQAPFIPYHFIQLDVMNAF